MDTAAQTLTLADGSEIAYDELIIATGLVPKRIPSFPDLQGIHVLRSFDESLALREEAGSARRAVVVGAGFIGCEVAASLRGWASMSSWWNRSRRRSRRCSASRSARWWRGCTAPKASTCAAASGSPRSAEPSRSRRSC